MEGWTPPPCGPTSSRWATTASGTVFLQNRSRPSLPGRWCAAHPATAATTAPIDLRNHLTAVRGFLEQGDEQGAIGYLDQIAGSPALRGTRRLCENEAANAVLTAKAEAMEREGVAADFAVFLPRDLPVADMDRSRKAQHQRNGNIYL